MFASAGRSPAAAAGDPAIPSLFYPLVASGRMAGAGEGDLISGGQGRAAVVGDSAQRVAGSGVAFWKLWLYLKGGGQ